MTHELRRIVSSPLYWLLIIGPVALDGALAKFQRLYSPETYWSFIDQFWDKLGLAAIAAMVLTVCLELISCDRVCRTEGLVLTTKFGRKNQFRCQIAACALGAALFSLALSIGNFLCALVLSQGIPVPSGWLSIYLGHTLLAAVGGALLALIACALCDCFHSLPIAFALVSLVLLFSTLTADMTGAPAPWYFLANGFFAKLIRGRALTGWSSYSPPWGIEWWGWSLWHLFLTAFCIFCAVRKRKERNQW